jgi:membrane protease YdiL (CAAX protease family)
MLIPLAVYIALRRERLEFLTADVDNVNAILIFFLSIVIQPYLMLIISIIAFFEPTAIPGTLLPAREALPIAIMNLAAIPALCEGVVFRGYLLSGSTGGGKTKKALAVMLSGLCLGLLQFSLPGFPYPFVTGLLFASVTLLTRSLKAGVFAHFCVNAAQYLLTCFAVALRHSGIAGVSIAFADFQSGRLQLILNLLIIALIFLPVTAILARTFLSHNRIRNMRQDLKDKLD